MPHIDHLEQVCDSCLAGKHHRTPFPKTVMYRAAAPLELVHADLCGPIAPLTPDKRRDFVLIVDDLTRYMWVSLIRSKDEALDALKKWHNRAEIEAGRKLKAL